MPALLTPTLTLPRCPLHAATCLTQVSRVPWFQTYYSVTAENASKAGIKGPLIKHCSPPDLTGLFSGRGFPPDRSGWDAQCIAGNFNLLSLDWWDSGAGPGRLLGCHELASSAMLELGLRCTPLAPAGGSCTSLPHCCPLPARPRMAVSRATQVVPGGRAGLCAARVADRGAHRGSVVSVGQRPHCAEASTGS